MVAPAVAQLAVTLSLPSTNLSASFAVEYVPAAGLVVGVAGATGSASVTVTSTSTCAMSSGRLTPATPLRATCPV